VVDACSQSIRRLLEGYSNPLTLTLSTAAGVLSFLEKIGGEVLLWRSRRTPSELHREAYTNQRFDDKRFVMAAASPSGYDCDYVGFMTNNHLDTTMMNGQGVETTVGTSSGDMPPLSE
jgi:hypothetical protein